MKVEYYIFSNIGKANAAINYINNTSWIVNKTAKMDVWTDAPLLLTDGNYAVKRINNKILDAVGVGQSERNVFLSTFIEEIREITGADTVK